MKHLLAWVMSVCAAAAATGYLTGVVTDPSGGVIIGASVIAVERSEGTYRAVNTGADGVFILSGLRPGIYKVTVRYPGFKTQIHLNQTVQAGATTALDVALQLGSSRESTVVTGLPEMSRLQGGTTSATILGAAEMSTLPINGRNLTNLLELAPGIVATPATAGEAGQFNGEGMRPNANAFLVDGLPANNAAGGGGLPAQFGGASLPGMTAFGSMHAIASLEDVAAVRIETAPTSAEFGIRPGTQIAIETRAGSNETRFGVQHAWRSSVLSANHPFAREQHLGRLPWSLHQGGATAAGPLRKDKFFYFASGEFLRMRQPFESRVVAPTEEWKTLATPALRALLNEFPKASGPAFDKYLVEHFSRTTLPAGLGRLATRVDYAASSKATVFMRWQETRSNAQNGYPQQVLSRLRTWSVTGGANLLLSPLWPLEVRANWSQTAATSVWNSKNPDLRQLLGRPNDEAGLYSVAIEGVGRWFSGSDGENRQQAKAVAVTTGRYSNHGNFRFGLNVIRNSLQRDEVSSITSGAWRIADTLASREASATTTSLRVSAAAVGSATTALSLWVEDARPLHPRLQLHYGVRWEVAPSPSIQAAPTPDLNQRVLVARTPAVLWQTRMNQFAPRIGIAFRASAGTVIRGGVGVFYDTGFSVGNDPVNGFPFNRWSFSPISGGASETIFSYAPDLRLPQSQHWHVEMTQQLTTVTKLSLGYVGSRSRSLARREGSVVIEEVTLRETQSRSISLQSLQATNHGMSDYHGLQGSLHQRLKNGLQARASWTWSHSIDNGSMDSAIFRTFEGPGVNDRASSSFDVRHSFSAVATWTGERLARHWTVSGVFKARSGFPIDVLSSQSIVDVGFDNWPRPNLVGGQPRWLDQGSLNRAAFANPAVDEPGTLGRNSIRGFGMWQADMAVQRSFTLSEKAGLALRVEAFNLLNHTLRADPVRFLDSPLFGRSASLLSQMLGTGSPGSGLSPILQTGTPRTVQLTLRLSF